MSNAYITEHATDGVRAVMKAYMTAYRYPSRADAAGELPTIPGPFRFNLVTTVFSRTPGHDWRIEEQRMVAAFAFAQ